MSKCPRCGKPEIPMFSPWTHYECGSMDYDQRPDTFKKGENCQCVHQWEPRSPPGDPAKGERTYLVCKTCGETFDYPARQLVKLP